VVTDLLPSARPPQRAAFSRCWSDPARVRRVALVLALLACTALRLVHLEADTPVNVGTGSMGLYIDEGYKTLAARNIVLFGAARWHPEDQYPGWQRASRLTHWSYLAMFELFEARLGSARLVTIAFYFLFLLAYAFSSPHEHPTWLVLVGVALLSVSYVLFFFSRVALLEMPVAVALYVAIFALRTQRLRHVGASPLLIGAVALTATFLIKRSAILYFVPPLCASVAAAALWSGRSRQMARVWGPAALAFLALAAFLTKRAWVWRLQIDPPATLRQVFVNPLTSSTTPLASSSVLLVCLGMLCALLLLLRDPRKTLTDPYLCSLVAIITVGPILLALFPYNPLRYYVPILPAYVLIVVEWLAGAPWRAPKEGERSPLQHLGLPLLAWLIFVCGVAVNEFVLHRLPVAIGETPGISMPIFYRLFLPFSILLALASWPLRNRVLAGRALALLAGVLLIATLARDLWVVGRFLGAPSYRSREISAALVRIVGERDSVGGDIAPFFALGTRVRALPIAPHTNSMVDNPDLRVDYFQLSETNEGRAILDFERERGTRLGPSLYESSYAGRAVSLHRIHYADRPASAASSR
jgi:hypothetical protein